jgi:hypothetical protein
VTIDADGHIPRDWFRAHVWIPARGAAKLSVNRIGKRRKRLVEQVEDHTLHGPAQWLRQCFYLLPGLTGEADQPISHGLPTPRRAAPAEHRRLVTDAWIGLNPRPSDIPPDSAP